MTHKENWLEKTFDFDFPTSKYTEFLEFLLQTPTRLETLVESLSQDVLIRRDGESWSIQENVGHFLTVETYLLNNSGKMGGSQACSARLRTPRPPFLRRYVETLFVGRLEDYQNNAETLRPARFGDNLTNKANYNTKDIRWILREFRAQREAYMDQLDALEPEEFGKVSLHPRLQKPIRICDMLLFHAKHDQHHLERIKELKEQWQV